MPANLGKKLKESTTAVRIGFHWLGTHKTLDSVQKAKAASPFGADHSFLSASHKLLDTKHPAYRKLVSIKNQIKSHWELNTLPYTDDSIRLLPKDQIPAFDDTMKAYAQELHQAATEFDDAMDEIKTEAAKRLGTLYNPSHYPDSVVDNFRLEWSFPSVEPPEYLAKLAPEIYKTQQKEAELKFQKAVQLAEAAFLEEFQDLIATLHDRLTPDADGAKKTFKDSTVNNLVEFFHRFKALNVGSSQDLDALVEQAESLVKGITPQELRDGDLLRAQIANEMKALDAKLAPLVEKLPRRKILRSTLKEPTNGTPLSLVPASPPPQESIPA